MEETLEEHKQFKLQQRLSLLVTIMLILAVCLCLYACVQVLSRGYVNIGGFMMFRVVTGSMEPTIPVGALLLTKEVDIDSVRINDIICFRTQVSEIWGKIVTHRVVGIMDTQWGSVLLETKGDANLAIDGFFVDSTNFVGKVIWHTGDGSVLANILSLFTSKIGFLGCIVFPCLVLATMIMRDSVSNIRAELAQMLELERQQAKADWENDPLCGMTQEEYDEMYQRIRAELMEELMQLAAEIRLEQQAAFQTEKTEKSGESSRN
jgi:signal peptidase